MFGAMSEGIGKVRKAAYETLSDPRPITDAEWAALEGKYFIYRKVDNEGPFFRQYIIHEETNREEWTAIDAESYDGWATGITETRLSMNDPQTKYASGHGDYEYAVDKGWYTDANFVQDVDYIRYGRKIY